MIAGDPLDRLPSAAIAALYCPQQAGSWELTVTPLTICPGYWGPPRGVENMAALRRGGDVWMSLTPLEVESQAIGIAAARGHVVIMGLGMGWAAAECALDPDVEAVTVIERDPEVIALHRELALFERLERRSGGKVRIVEGDALEWRPDAPVDLLMPDIWLPLVSPDDRAAEVRRMQAGIGAAAVYFWGQELELARQAAARGLAIDAAGIAQVIADWGLPLVGPETPDYAARTRAAAKAWMRGRWLPGTENPLA
jgi:hypothetical protein